MTMMMVFGVAMFSTRGWRIWNGVDIGYREEDWY